MRAANRAAPRPPNAPPSVERKTIVCAGRTRCAAGVLGLAVAARELDERRRARRVVVRARAGADVVAVGEDDDRVGRLPGGDRPEVLEADAAEPGTRLRATCRTSTGSP